MVELLLILAQEGVAGNLLLNGSPSLRRRAAQFIALDPARNWRLKDVCDLLGMSESALRRKLRAAGVPGQPLRTVWGQGYTLATEAAGAEPSAPGP